MGIKGFDAWLTTPPEGPEMSSQAEEIYGLLEEATVDQRVSVISAVTAILQSFNISSDTMLAITNLVDDITVSDDLKNKITDIVDSLAYAAANCPKCEARRAEAETKMEAEAQKEWEEARNAPLPEVDTCPHGEKSHECNACLVAGDLAYDAARERGWR